MPDAQAKPVFMGGLMRLEEMNLFGEEPVAQTVKNLPAKQETQVQSSGLGRSPGEGNGNPLQ